MGQDLANAFATGEKKKNIVWIFNTADGAISPEILTEMKTLFGQRLKNNVLNAKDGAKSKIELVLEASDNEEFKGRFKTAMNALKKKADQTLLDEFFKEDIQPVLDEMIEAGATLEELVI